MTAIDETVSNPGAVSDQVTRLLLEQDLKIIADALLEEAQERDWCGEYDTYVDRVNARTSQPWLKHCERWWTATFTVTVSFKAISQADGVEPISDHLQNFDDCDVEIDSATVTLRDTAAQ